MPKKFRQESEVQLIPYYEYDPSIHNIEYRYLPTQSEEGFQDFSSNYTYDSSDAYDWYRRPRPIWPVPVPPFWGHPAWGHPGWGHPGWGHPGWGHPGWGHQPGWHGGGHHGGR